MTPKQILSIIWRRWWIVALAFASTLAGAGGLLLLVPPRYDAIAVASIDPGQVDPVTGQAPATMAVRIIQGNLVALVKSQRVAVDVVKRLNMQQNTALVANYNKSDAVGRMDFTDWMATELLRNVDAKFAEGSNVLSITYKSPSPVQSALIANTFLSGLVDEGLAMKVNSAQQAATWFEPQMDKMRADLNVARAKLAQFQRDSKLLAVTAGSDSENQELLLVSNELSSARSQLLSLQSQLAATAGKDSEGTLEAQVNDTPTLTTLKGSLASVTAEIGKQQREVGENNPKLAGLIAQRGSLQQQIRSEIAASRAINLSKVNALMGQVAFLEKARAEKVEKLISVQTQRDQLATLQRDVEFRQTQVDNSSRAAASARLQSQLSFSNISTMDNATPPVSAAFPKIMIIVPLAIGMGLMLGILFALIAEALDRRIRGIADLDFAVAAPVLGTLMKYSAGSIGSGRGRRRALPWRRAAFKAIASS